MVHVEAVSSVQLVHLGKHLRSIGIIDAGVRHLLWVDLPPLVCAHSWSSLEMGRLAWMGSSIYGDDLMHQDLIGMNGLIKVVEIL